MMGSDQYCLKWNNHWANLVRVFNALRHSETFVDVTLACEGRHLKAHRLVLSACSPYFKELLVSHPDRHPIVILKDVRFAELQSLVQFIYNGEVSVDQQDLASLLGTAKELQIRGLADSVSKSLPSSLAAKTIQVASESRSRKDSTNSSSIPLPTIPNDEPTNLTVRSNLSHYSNGISHSVTELPSPSSLDHFPPHRIPHIPPPEASDRPPTPKENCANAPDGGSAETMLRGGSPQSKRRKLSTMQQQQELAAKEAALYTIPDEVIRMNLLSPLSSNKNEAGPSGVSTNQSEGLVEVKEENNSVHEESGDEKENLEPEVDIFKQPKDKPPDSQKRSSVQDCDSDAEGYGVNIQPPEVILEEEDSGAITTNGTSSPALARSTSAGSAYAETASTSTVPTALSSHMSFLQQAIAMGLQQPLHFMHPSVDRNQSTKASPGSQRPLSPSGLMQAKNILSFVDFLKSMGASIPACTQTGLSASPTASAHSSSVPSSPSPVFSNSSSRDQEKNTLTCHICARIMPSIQVLEEHVRIHEEEKPYKCEQCGQRYKYQSAFQRHQEQNHTAKLPGDKPYRCDVCGQCFKYHKSFTKHRANHDLLDNFLKGEPGADDKGAIRALQESYLQRLLHPSSFQHAEGLLTSVKEEVKDPSDQELLKDVKSPCTESSTSLPGALGPENGEIKEEEDDDIDIDEIVPDVPGEGEEDMEESSSSGRFFYCTQCKLTFRDSKSYDGHCRLSRECSSETLKEVTVGGDISVTSIPSGGAASSQSSPQPSLNISQGGLTTLTDASPLSTSMVFSSPPAMLYTLVRGLTPTSCFPNVSTTPTILNLSKFVNINNIPNIPANIRPHESLNFASAGIPSSVNCLLAGIEEERPFKCPYCQKGFKGRENLKLHIRTHTGEKPYNCGVCGKAFGGRSDMNRHLRIHTGEKPYPCKVCGKKFARADYLSKHITTHLGIPFAKPVHSLQQSLQNLENMQNLQNLENMQNLLPANLSLAALPSLQNLPSLTSLQAFPNLQNLQSVHNLQSATDLSQHTPLLVTTTSCVTSTQSTPCVTTTSCVTSTHSVDSHSVSNTHSVINTHSVPNNKEEIPNLSK